MDLTAIPQATGAVSVLPDQSWSFQAWHQDANPATTGNFNNGLQISY